MKFIYLFFLLLMIPMADLLAQVEVRCNTMELTSEGEWKPLSGVEVVADGAAPVVSDQEGRFVLSFSKAKVGDPLKIDYIRKSGYETINSSGLEQRVISPKYELTIVMGARDQFLKACDAYMQLTNSTYAMDYAERRRVLNEERDAALRNEEEYRLRLEELEEDYRARLRSLDVYLEQFPNRGVAPANPSNAVERLLNSFVREAADFSQLMQARELLLKAEAESAKTTTK